MEVWYACRVRFHRSLIAVSLILGFALVDISARAQRLEPNELPHWMNYVIDLERQVSRHGDDVPLMIRLTDAYVRIGDARRAGPALERLADLDVEPLRLDLLRGDLYFNLRDYDQAARAYLDALAHFPRQTYALSQLWRLMLEVTLNGAEVRFDRHAVIETLQRAGLFFPGAYTPAANSSEQAARLVDRANALLLRQHPEEALVALTRAISLDPGNADAFAALARAYHESNDPESAIGASLVYLILAPDAPDAPRIRSHIGRQIEQINLR